MKVTKILSLFIVSLLFLSCSRDKENNGSSMEDSFDRKEMTQFWADDFILPALGNFKSKANSLNSDAIAFANEPNDSNLNNLRSSLHQSYLAYQYIGFFQIGKAEETTMNYQYRLNTYPTNEGNVTTFALNNDYNFRAISKIAPGEVAQGLPAIDYMVNGFASDNASILAKYTTDANAENYRNYLTALTNEMVASTDEVINDWNSGYRDTFINNQSNNAAGSLSLIVNNFIKYYEKHLRAGKIGYPAGILTPMYIDNSTAPKPYLVEAYYSNQYNKMYALEGLKAMKNFFNGVGFDGSTNGKSLKQYIEYLDAKQTNQQLALSINQKLEESKSKIEALDNSFVVQLNNDVQPMKDAYYSLQSNMVNLKVSMPQILNVTISYMDTDGD